MELHLSGLHHLDHACRTALENWAERHSAAGTEPVKLTAAKIPEQKIPATK